MHPQIENFLQRPTSHKVGAWVVTLIVGFGAFYQYSYSGKLKAIENLNDEVIKLESNITTERRLAAKLDKAREKLKELDAQLKTALEELPDRSELDDILEKVSNLARESGLELNIFQRKDENFKEFFAEVPVNVSISGTYHQVATFFDEVGRLPRIVNINQIQVADPKIGEEQISVKVDCVLTAYRFLSEAERVQRAPGDAKKKRGAKARTD